MELGTVLLLCWVYTASVLHSGQQKRRIHLVVLHEVPLKTFSLLALDTSQGQRAESQFIQIPRAFGMESFNTS